MEHKSDLNLDLNFTTTDYADYTDFATLGIRMTIFLNTNYTNFTNIPHSENGMMPQGGWIICG